MKKYNNKYKNVVYNNKNWRLYDEKTTTSLDALYSEMQIKLIELIEEHNFKIFYFNCKPATQNKLIIKDGNIDLKANNIKIIKNNQESDLYYLYKNQICEIFYSFLKLDNNNNYFFDFMLVVKNNFNLNSVYNYNFKTIIVNSVNEIHKNDISFEFIENIYNQRIITDNNCGLIYDENCYDIGKLAYGIENYRINIKNGSDDFDFEEYSNFNSFHFHKLFDQDQYAKGCFRLLCSQIWAIDRFYYKEKNGYGYRIAYKEKYKLELAFLTNYAELFGCVSYSLNSNGDADIKNKFYTYCSISDNLPEQGILLVNFNFDQIHTNEIDFDKLKIFDENYRYE